MNLETNSANEIRDNWLELKFKLIIIGLHFVCELDPDPGQPGWGKVQHLKLAGTKCTVKRDGRSPSQPGELPCQHFLPHLKGMWTLARDQKTWVMWPEFGHWDLASGSERSSCKCLHILLVNQLEKYLLFCEYSHTCVCVCVR